MTGPYFLRHLETGQKNFLPHSLCLGALPLLYPAAPPSVFACGKYTAPAVALEREYVVDFLCISSDDGALFFATFGDGAKIFCPALYA